MRLSEALWLGAFLGLLPSVVFGGRPLVIDDAMPVGRNEVEVEFGFFHGWPTDGGREQQFPVMTLAYGLIRDLEVGLALHRVNSDAKGEPPRKGFEDLHLNTKYLLLKEGEALPALAFAFDLKVPTANRSKGLTTGRVDENFLLIATKNLGALALDSNLGYLLVDSPKGEKLKNRIQGGLALRWRVHPQWSLVGEIFGLSREAKGEKNEASFQIGARYFLTRQLVLDAAAGRSLRSSGLKIQGTFGLTWTFPLSLF